MVAWNASREATRAVNDAMPILTSAKSVTVRGDFGPSRVPYHKITGHRQPTPLDHAAAHLRGKGWTILARNWTQDAHSLDLVARDPGGVIVAVLVSHSEDGDPLAQITAGAITSQVMGQTDKALLDADEHAELAQA